MHFYLRKAALYRDMLVGRLVCPTRVLVFSKRDKTVLYVYANSYDVTMLQRYTTLQYQNVAMLQCYNVTMLCYNVKILSCNVTMIQCYNVTISKCYNVL